MNSFNCSLVNFITACLVILCNQTTGILRCSRKFYLRNTLEFTEHNFGVFRIISKQILSEKSIKKIIILALLQINIQSGATTLYKTCSSDKPFYSRGLFLISIAYQTIANRLLDLVLVCPDRLLGRPDRLLLLGDLGIAAPIPIVSQQQHIICSIQNNIFFCFNLETRSY